LSGFTWRDGDRLIRFGRGAVAEAVELAGGPGYTLLTTERAAAAAPALREAAAAEHRVAPGLVEEVAGTLRDAVTGDRLVALGGGRVIDVAKALAAAGRARVIAVPTTLSGAEMTRGHRSIADAPNVRPAVVVNDPALSASQPVPELAASALNALGHAVEAPCTRYAHPVATLAAHDAARRLVLGFARREPDRDELALGALLAGYTIDTSGIGLHHVLAQTLVRAAGIGHAAANAVMLPYSLGALTWRFPNQLGALAAALDEDPGEAARRIAALTGPSRSLSELELEWDRLATCANVAAARPELANTPPAADRAEILALYEHAY
jgi:alcohol dehydrogenase class IV